MHCALSLSFFLTSDDIILDAGFVIIRLTETRTLYPVRVCTLPLSPISNVHFTILCAYKWKITNSGLGPSLFCITIPPSIVHHLLSPLCLLLRYHRYFSSIKYEIERKNRIILYISWIVSEKYFLF